MELTLLSSLRAQLDDGDQQSAVPGMHRSPRLRTVEQRTARSAYHYVHTLEMNGDSYRLKQSRRKRFVWASGKFGIRE
jgi:hypothetical protein